MPFGFGNEITEALLMLPRKHINVWKITAKASALKETDIICIANKRMKNEHITISI
jgi:hypothetical protein